MDFGTGTGYSLTMLGRFVTVLTVIAIAVVTTVTSAHAARMTSGIDHAEHIRQIIDAAIDPDEVCEDLHACGTVDAGFCELVCLGLAALLTPQTPEGAQDLVASGYEIFPGACHLGRSPGLNERPPKLGLL